MIKYFIISIVVSALVPFILSLSLIKKTKCDDENVIKPISLHLFLGCLTIVILILAFILFCTQEFNKIKTNSFDIGYCLGVVIMFIISTLLFGTSPILYWRNWRLYLGEKELEFRNFFGIKRTYKYSEIIEITTHYDKSKTNIEQYKICLKNRKICVNMYHVNFDKFERIIKKRMKKKQS